jgi:rhamnosyl/mannosyltransferase
MNILLVASEAPPINSGVARCVAKLSTGLRERGHQVDVISGVQIPRVSFGEWRFSSFVAYWPRIAQRLATYDLVNLHGPVPTMSDVFLALTRKRAGAQPLVYTHHSAIEIRGLKRACEIYGSLHRKLTGAVDLTITTSSYYRDYHVRPGGPPVEVVPWGVDMRPQYPAKTSEPGRLRVLFVGQMRPYKGVDVLLKAVARQPQIELRLVGDGPRRAHHQQVAAELAAANATFLGRVSDEQLRAEYERADVIVLPSLTRAEAFGLVTLEGMMAGCVPVVSDLPGVATLAESTGRVVRPGDHRALRAALLDLGSDVPRLRMLQAASRRYAESLSWDACVARYEEAFAALVDSRRQDRRILTGVEAVSLPGPRVAAVPVAARIAAGAGAAAFLADDRLGPLAYARPRRVQSG